MKSWAVPKGPSDDPADKRLAMQTEDHPLDYADFEGEIPKGNYGAGHVIVWDRGTYIPLEAQAESFATAYAKGKLLFELNGYKMHGRWTLVKLKSRAQSKRQNGNEWLLIKEQDAFAVDTGCSFTHESILSGLTVAQLARPGHRLAALRRSINKTPGTQQSSLPSLKPMLAKAGDAHRRKGWVWELKYDGYRICASKQFGQVQLKTRNGHNISQRFPEVCQSLSHLLPDDLVVDGEIVINDASGRPDFALMQQRARSMTMHQVSVAAIEQPATYYVFDLLYLLGVDLRQCTLLNRKQILQQLIPAQGVLRYSEHVTDGLRTYQTALQLGIEGVVGKRAASLYQPGRQADWIKVRNQRTDEFIVVGWSPSRQNSNDIGSLALAEYRIIGNKNKLVYVGHAGSGLSGPLREALTRKFARLQRKTPPVEQLPEKLKSTHWLRPHLVVEIAFAEYTPSGLLRHPSIARLRDDKSPPECIGQFIPDPGANPDDTQPLNASAHKIVTTNPEKILFSEAGFKKEDLVAYYRGVSPWLLPYLIDRPIVLTRFPDGDQGKSFYQRDAPDYAPDWIRREVLWSESTDKPVRYFVLEKPEDLAYIANMGTMPIHLWHSRISTLSQADWCVIDLDPKRAPFADVVTLALAIRDLCDELELPAYPKTSGMSGLHVLIPLRGQLNHEQSRTLAELLATVLTRRYPDIATIARSVRARQNKVYVDFMQNGHGRLIAAPFCVRPSPQASVSMPLRWQEVNRGLNNTKYHIGNAIPRLKRLSADPMQPLLTEAPDLERSLARHSELLR